MPHLRAPPMSSRPVPLVCGVAPLIDSGLFLTSSTGMEEFWPSWAFRCRHSDSLARRGMASWHYGRTPKRAARRTHARATTRPSSARVTSSVRIGASIQHLQTVKKSSFMLIGEPNLGKTSFGNLLNKALSDRVVHEVTQSRGGEAQELRRRKRTRRITLL